MTNMNSNGAFLKTSSHASSATLCDFPTVLDGRISGTVIGQAVAPSCLAKSSRCDRKCRFPTRGGLHRSSKGVSSTASLSLPPWCHVDKSTLLPQQEPVLLPLHIWTNSQEFLIILPSTRDIKTNNTIFRRESVS